MSYREWYQKIQPESRPNITRRPILLRPNDYSTDVAKILKNLDDKTNRPATQQPHFTVVAKLVCELFILVIGVISNIDFQQNQSQAIAHRKPSLIIPNVTVSRQNSGSNLRRLKLDRDYGARQSLFIPTKGFKCRDPIDRYRIKTRNAPGRLARKAERAKRASFKWAACSCSACTTDRGDGVIFLTTYAKRCCFFFKGLRTALP